MADYSELLKLLQGGQKEEPMMSEEVAPMSLGEPASLPEVAPMQDTVEQKAKQDVVNKTINSEVAAPNAAKDSGLKREPAIEKVETVEQVEQAAKPKSLDDLMREYLGGRERHVADLKVARESDKRANAFAQLAGNLANLAQSDMQARSGANIKKTDFSKMPKFDDASAIERDRKSQLDDLLTAKKLQDITKDAKGLSEFQKRTLGLKERELDIKEREAKDKPKKLDITKAQEAVDKEFAKTYAKYRTAGGFQDARKQLGQLREASDYLGSDEAKKSSRLTGVLPKSMRDLTSPKKAAIEDAIAEVVQRTLRENLGGQFSEKEGQALIDRAYNPRLSAEENQKRVGRLIQQVEDAIVAKESAARYYEEHGTLQNYDGPTNVRDILGLSEKVESPKKESTFAGRQEGDTWSDDKFDYRVVNGKVQRKAK